MFRKFAFMGFLLACGGFEARADDPRAEAVARFIDADVVMVCRINIDHFDVKELTRRLVEDEASAVLVTRDLAPWFSALRKAGARDLYVIATMADLTAAAGAVPSGVATLSPGADPAAVGRVLCGKEGTQPRLAWPSCASFRDVVYAGSNESVQALGLLKPVARPELAEALAASTDSVAEVVLMPSADSRRVLEEMIPSIPSDLGGGPVTLLTKGLRWGVLSLLEAPAPSVRLVLQAKDAASAESVAQLGKKLDLALRQSTTIAQYAPDYRAVADHFTAQVNEDRITIASDVQAAGIWAGGMLKSARQAEMRSQCVNNFKQIGLAMHNYLAAHGTFPPAYVADKAGKPLLSWRVLILPYVEQQALYNEFHLDEPWDSPHNKPLIDRMPEVYACPSELGKKLEPGRTTYVTPRGAKTMFSGAVGVKIKEVTDGTSVTIMTLELPGDQAVTWTKPDDWDVPAVIDPKSLLSRHLRGSNVGFADGSVRFMTQSIAPAILHELTTMNGGEVIDSNSY